MLSTLYRIATNLGAPAIGFYLHRRRKAGREDPERFSERLGQASYVRPAGRVVWCHAASVGEAVSLMLLIEKLHDTYPDLHIVVTTGTVTAARMMVERLPAYARHQYVPVDRSPYVKKFLDHWRPNLAIWVESELWPNILAGLRERSIPVVLLNARMSERSFRNWHRVKSFAHELVSSFSLTLAQTENDRGRFVALGAKPVKCIGNLKYASAPLPFDAQELVALKLQTPGCMTWLMASTHRGEEEMAIAAHRAIEAKHARLLTVIAPRHAARGEEIVRLLETSGLRFARRSKGEPILPDTQIYLADTMGEMGLFYAFCPLVVMGGSFVRIGGHNPIEPAQAGAAIIVGPYMYNFSEIMREFTLAQAILPLQHDNEIAFVVDRLLAHPQEAANKAHAARMLAGQKRYVLDQIIAELDPWLRIHV